jgi:hypothetical protein
MGGGRPQGTYRGEEIAWHEKAPAREAAGAGGGRRDGAIQWRQTMDGGRLSGFEGVVGFTVVGEVADAVHGVFEEGRDGEDREGAGEGQVLIVNIRLARLQAESGSTSASRRRPSAVRVCSRS